MGYLGDHKKAILILVDSGFVSREDLELELWDIDFGHRVKIVTSNQLQVNQVETFSNYNVEHLDVMIVSRAHITDQLQQKTIVI